MRTITYRMPHSVLAVIALALTCNQRCLLMRPLKLLENPPKWNSLLEFLREAVGG